MNFVFYKFYHVLFFPFKNNKQITGKNKGKLKHMKKILVCMVVAMSLFTVSSFAQGGRGGGGERYKQMLKDSIGLSDVQVDSVMAIRQEFQPQMRDIFMDQSMSQDDKRAKIAEVNQQMKARYKGTLTDEQIAKLDAMQQRMMERMRNRGGGGNR